MNTLYYGDNLEIMKEHIKDESVDLIYLDPPFQSGRNYNIIFNPKQDGIKGATSQINAFEDTWVWGMEAEREYSELIMGTLTREKPTQKLIDLMKAMRSYLDACPLMAYICMMAPRLLEMKRVLKPTGSIYLHCDPTASHYLKLLMDAVFEPKNYRNEITWKRTSAHSDSKRFGANTDIILFYSKTENYKWFNQYTSHDEKYLSRFRNTDPDGRKWTDADLSAKGLSGGGYEYEYKGCTSLWRVPLSTMERLDAENRLIYTNISNSKNKGIRLKRYLDENKGTTLQCLWDDIPPINSQAKERMGYPTQKPEALLERIISANSNEGDIILDPFCGCGTAVAVAERLNRKWVGIDITYLSIDVIRKRFEKNKIREKKDFIIKGTPTDYHSASKLAETAPFQFEVWAVSQLNAMPTVKTGDKGVDGVINFIDQQRKDKIGKGIISVKGGKSINPAMVRDLKGTVESQDADFGILITLVEPTKGMIEEAAKAGTFEYSVTSLSKPFVMPRIQIVTAEQLFSHPIPVVLPNTAIDPFNKPDIKKNKIYQDEIEM
ncbi:MAG: restriction endonuclease [Candidatus Cloacimonetes bacterium]|nr:restriction endonuclease [Candidatus Cloacimonadota bacterium]